MLNKIEKTNKYLNAEHKILKKNKVLSGKNHEKQSPKTEEFNEKIRQTVAGYENLNVKKNRDTESAKECFKDINAVPTESYEETLGD